MNQPSLLLLIASALLMVTSCTPETGGSESATTSPTSDAWLSVSGDQIIDQTGNPVFLRGFGLGGMLHMENFINGFPGTEEAVREGLLDVLGQEKYDLYFQTLYQNYFTEPDAAYIRSLGLNLIRIPVNYHLFEDDMNPGVYHEDAFRHLDRVVELCARYQIYVIIDLHALPGFQNQNWHSDNPTHKALFWKHKDFQDRALHLWEAIAERYKDEPWVAGYDLINEPADPTEERVFPYYKRLYEAIRAIDPRHILFLEGNRYAKDFNMFTEILDNVVYTNHDYAAPGLMNGGDYPGYTAGRYVDRDTLEQDFLTRSQYMFDNGVPVWVGEFGPVYTGDPESDEMRYQVLMDQLAIYDKYQVSWCIWLYKDLGLQAVLSQDENTPYMRLVGDFLKRKNRLGADQWGSTDEQIRQVTKPLEELFAREFSDYNPFPYRDNFYIHRLVRNILISEALVPEYVELFRGATDEQLVALAESFRFEHYNKRSRLEEMLSGSAVN